MNRSILVRRGLIWTAGALGSLLVLAAWLAAAIEAGYFRGPLLRYIAAQVGRPIKVEGDLHLHLFALQPWVTAEHVTIGNPAWVPPGTAAVIGRLSFAIDLPWVHWPPGIVKLDMEEATLTLSRDDAGLANWQRTDPRVPDDTLSPLLRHWSVPGARVLLKDDTRHLQFDGTITVKEPSLKEGPPPLRIEGTGQLNGRPVRFGIDGEPLAIADHAKPYRFKFEEQSSGTQLSGGGALPRPFDFRLIDAEFTATGQDLEDLYFLTGVKLVNTGRYRLAGKVARRGTKTRFTDLEASSGQSDAHGSASIDSSSDRPQLDIDLHSQVLRLADLGLRAAGRDPQGGSGKQWLMSDAALNPHAWRRDDTVATFRAGRLEVGPIPVQDVAAALAVEHGVLTVTPLTGHVFEGDLTAHVRANLTTDDPADSLDLKISNLNLERYLPHGADEPLMKGLLQARVLAKGHGRSVHEFAASADGTLSAVVQHGALRAALADLGGLDFRAIGLLFSKHGPDTAVRCGVASFQAHDGVLAAQTLVLDTEPVLIVGEGNIHMDSEAIDLTLRGHPKRLGFRIRSPALVRGTLSHPSFAIQPRDAGAQVAAAVALGALLTPLASALAFVDPGLTKDADCGALMMADKTLRRDEPAPPQSP
jgi:AsmA family protein